MQTKDINLNPAQAFFAHAQCRVSTVIAARGLGKSDGILGPRTLQNVHAMPRGNTALVCETFMQGFVRTIPPLIRAWERFGFMEDVHFWVKKEAPKELRLPKAYIRPRDMTNYISTYTGHGFYIISQDRAGMSNGLSVDAIVGDEAKYLDYDQFKSEALPALRGNEEYFKQLWQHKSILFATDMPTTPEAQWIFEYEKKANPKHIEKIVQLSVELARIESKIKYRKESYALKLQSKANKIRLALNALRKENTLYMEASIFANLKNIGIDVLRNYKQAMTDLEFRAAILNERVYMIRNLFYASFDLKRHCYTAYDYSKFDSADFSRQLEGEKLEYDLDHNPQEVLHIGLDYNTGINTLVVGQHNKEQRSFKIINSFYVKEPRYLPELIDDFCNYYKGRSNKSVVFYYDHTAIPRSADGRLTFAQQVQNKLNEHGWYVDMYYLGQASRHETRYNLYDAILKENHQNLPKLRINKAKCEELVEAIRRAPAKLGKKLEKDKKSERDENTPAEYATHFTEAMDMLIMGAYAPYLS